MTSPWLRRALEWRQLWPAFRSGAWVLLLFAVGLGLASYYAQPVEQALHEHAVIGIALFVLTSALAVVLPFASNLPLVPLAVLAWGPGWTAALLLIGWIAGSAFSFVLGRHTRGWILQRFPSVQRHADIDRLIHPHYRLASLISLRMTFPVDVLSYALGLFSRSTTLGEVMVSTALGAAPFAVLFAWFPTLPTWVQGAVLAASLVVFCLHLWWVLRATGEGSAGR